MAKTIGKKTNIFGMLQSKFSDIITKKAVKTPQLKNVRKLGSTPGNKSGFKILKRKKRSSIGISSLSRSKLSTPKFATDTKIETGSQKPKRRNRSNTVSPTTKAAGIKPLMPRVLMKKKYPTDATNPPTIVLDGTDEGIVCDESTNRLVAPPSPEIEILTVKITPNGSKKVKAPKSQAKNSQRIFSKFNIPNPVFPKAQDYIPLTSGEVKSRRQTRNSTGYRFDPKAKPNINFTPMENQMTGRVFSFQGSAAQNEKRRPTMGLNQLRASSRSKLPATFQSQSDVAPNAFHNVFVPEGKRPDKQGTLRTIVIDGQNVAVEHAKANGGLVIYHQGSSSGGAAAPKFSCEGISICVDYFRKRGHKEIIVFVPQFRSKRSQSDKPEILERLNHEGILKYTPCKQIDGRAYNSYDDRFIVQCASLKNAIIVSNDNYRDLAQEDIKLKDVIDKRVLKFVWVGNTLMFSQDPMGKTGPTLEEFLQH